MSGCDEVNGFLGILLRSAQPTEQGRPTEAPESVEKILLGFRLRAQTSIRIDCLVADPTGAPQEFEVQLATMH